MKTYFTQFMEICFIVGFLLFGCVQHTFIVLCRGVVIFHVWCRQRKLCSTCNCNRKIQKNIFILLWFMGCQVFLYVLCVVVLPTFWNVRGECVFSCLVSCIFYVFRIEICRSQWPRSLRRRSSAARLLRLWVRIPPGAWMFVCCECCVLSGRGLCDGLITRPEESYRLWRVVVCDHETSKKRRLKPATGL